VQVEYRKPWLAVKRENGYVVLDDDRVRLPGSWVDPAVCRIPIPLTGVLTSPPEAGEVWSDPAVSAGLEMARLAAAEPALRYLRIREIDVSNVGGRVDPRRPDLSLVCANRCILYWGRAPLDVPQLGEASTDGKLENLRVALGDYPRLDGLRYVKIYPREGPAAGLSDNRLGRRLR
jgi:hypothetical protein